MTTHEPPAEAADAPPPDPADRETDDDLAAGGLLRHPPADGRPLGYALVTLLVTAFVALLAWRSPGVTLPPGDALVLGALLGAPYGLNTLVRHVRFRRRNPTFDLVRPARLEVGQYVIDDWGATWRVTRQVPHGVVAGGRVVDDRRRWARVWRSTVPPPPGTLVPLP